MEFTRTLNGKSYVQIPDEVLEKELGSLKAVYIYAKILMLTSWGERKGKKITYNRESWVTNPISGKKEMSIDTLSDITNRLEQAGLIRKEKQDVGTQYKANRYEIIPFDGNYKTVMYDFINHTELSPDAKGLAILMSLLKFIPKSNSAIGKALGISGKTVKRYIAELEKYGIYCKDVRQLNQDCFPFWKQVNDKKMKWTRALYESELACIDTLDKEQVPTIERCKQWKMTEWISHLNESMDVQACLHMKAMTNQLGRKTKDMRLAEARALIDNEDKKLRYKPLTI
ncbi:MAG: hypothetical protein IJT12_04725 [Paludibacteraceae bacterium]|nr:hypothetical protein [Paludibacteraceae bacterium]